MAGSKSQSPGQQPVASRSPSAPQHVSEDGSYKTPRLNHSLTMPSKPSSPIPPAPSGSAISSPELHLPTSASKSIDSLKLMHQIEVARLENTITDLKEQLIQEMNRADTLQAQLIRVLEMQAEMQMELQQAKLKQVQ